MGKMGEFDKILFNKLRLVKIKQLHTQLVKLIFFPSRWEKRKINHLFPSAHNCNSWFSLVPHGRKKAAGTYFLEAFCRFPSYHKVKISKTFVKSCLTQKRNIQYIFWAFCKFSDNEILQKPGHKPIKVFLNFTGFLLSTQ